MPSLKPQQLTEAIISAFDDGDASAVSLTQTHSNPRIFLVQMGRNTLQVQAYIWTLTHGGGSARPTNEYRIQITGVRPPLTRHVQGATVLLGYEPNRNCFAGFDLAKHTTFSTRSPSIQIPITALDDALQYGFSFVRKGNDEIAVGIRPDQFLAYCLNAELLHREGANAEITNLLSKAVALEEITEGEIQQVPSERQRIIGEVSRLSRDSSFRRKVLLAYDRRCAVTRVQLRLIDVAHILPVGTDGSTDEIGNGLCLTPTYHRAFDQGLIYLDESLHMQINPEKERELVQAGLGGGLEDFKSYLGRRIHLPVEKAQWPKIDYIRAANVVRRI
jgi:putative restriction endonuclease